MPQLRWTTWAKVEPEKAFAYVTDVPRHVEWSMDGMKVEAANPGPPLAGSTFKATGHLFGKLNPSTVTVTDYDPPTLTFGFDAEDATTLTHHDFQFTAKDGGTQIDRVMTGKRGPWYGPIMFLLFKGKIDENFNGALAKLKTNLEATST